MSTNKTVRYRTVRSRKEGLKPVSGEYQVVRSREIIGRYDLLEQALKAHPDAQPDPSCF